MAWLASRQCDVMCETASVAVYGGVNAYCGVNVYGGSEMIDVPTLVKFYNSHERVSNGSKVLLRGGDGQHCRQVSRVRVTEIHPVVWW